MENTANVPVATNDLFVVSRLRRGGLNSRLLQEETGGGGNQQGMVQDLLHTHYPLEIENSSISYCACATSASTFRKPRPL